MFKNHPKGLQVLFFTELWERFGYYLMLGILFLYMIDNQRGGLALSNFDASDVYGTYIALVYLTPFVGGLLADRLLGYSKTIVIGGILMSLGYFGLAIPGSPLFFYLSLLLIIIGNGFFKPNISTLVGNLYNNPQYKDLKDSGFNIFYMGINIGAFICNFIAAYLRNQFSWGAAFAAAGVGMLLGVIIFMAGHKHVKDVDVVKPTKPGDMSLGYILGSVLVPAVVAGLLGWFIPGNILGSDSNDAFLFASLPVVVFYLSLFFKAKEDEKQPIAALLSIMAVVVIFWAVFHQNGSALTLWAEKYTDRTIPTVVEAPIDALKLTQKVDTTGRLVPVLDMHGAPVKDEAGNAKEAIGPHPYFENLPKEEWPASGALTLISTEIFQSVNPFFVVILTPVVVGFFNILRRKKKEPSTAGKIALGLLITAASTTIMMLAVVFADNGAMYGLDKSSALWLVTAYAVITVGELFLSPMGLSLVSKLSPPRITAIMMGGWFLATAIGNKLSGVISGLWEFFDNKVYFFGVNFIGAFLAALAIFLMLKWLNAVIQKHSA